MNKKRIFTLLRVLSLILLVMVMLYVIVRLQNEPELATAEGIVNLVSENRFLAAIEFIGLYLIKGISFVFPSAVLNVAAGAVFGVPLSILVSTLGILCEFMLLYFVGKIGGKDIANHLEEKNSRILKLRKVHMNNGAYISFIIRILGIVSYDVGSLYLGATGIKFRDFIIGSMAGAIINICLANIFGQYIFSPFCWQVIAVVGIRIAMVIFSMLIWKKDRVEVKEAGNTETE